MQTNNSKEKVRQLQKQPYPTAKNVIAEDFMHFTTRYIVMMYFLKHGNGKAKGFQWCRWYRNQDIEEMELKNTNTRIKSELMDGKYKPSPVKRVMIPKPDGSERPLEYQQSRTELCRWLPR